MIKTMICFTTPHVPPQSVELEEDRCFLWKALEQARALADEVRDPVRPWLAGVSPFSTSCLFLPVPTATFEELFETLPPLLEAFASSGWQMGPDYAPENPEVI